MYGAGESNLNKDCVHGGHALGKRTEIPRQRNGVYAECFPMMERKKILLPAQPIFARITHAENTYH